MNSHNVDSNVAFDTANCFLNSDDFVQFCELAKIFKMDDLDLNQQLQELADTFDITQKIILTKYFLEGESYVEIFNKKKNLQMNFLQWYLGENGIVPLNMIFNDIEYIYYSVPSRKNKKNKIGNPFYCRSNGELGEFVNYKTLSFTNVATSKGDWSPLSYLILNVSGYINKNNDQQALDILKYLSTTSFDIEMNLGYETKISLHSLYVQNKLGSRNITVLEALNIELETKVFKKEEGCPSAFIRSKQALAIERAIACNTSGNYGQALLQVYSALHQGRLPYFNQYVNDHLGKEILNNCASRCSIKSEAKKDEGITTPLSSSSSSLSSSSSATPTTYTFGMMPPSVSSSRTSISSSSMPRYSRPSPSLPTSYSAHYGVPLSSSTPPQHLMMPTSSIPFPTPSSRVSSSTPNPFTIPPTLPSRPLPTSSSVIYGPSSSSSEPSATSHHVTMMPQYLYSNYSVSSYSAPSSSSGLSSTPRYTTPPPPPPSSLPLSSPSDVSYRVLNSSSLPSSTSMPSSTPPPSSMPLSTPPPGVSYLSYYGVSHYLLAPSPSSSRPSFFRPGGNSGEAPVLQQPQQGYR